MRSKVFQALPRPLNITLDRGSGVSHPGLICIIMVASHDTFPPPSLLLSGTGKGLAEGLREENFAFCELNMHNCRSFLV